MGWSCEICTFQNAKDIAIKCEICETLRSDAIDLTNDTCSNKPILAKRKSSVQVKLTGGIAQHPSKLEAASKKSKHSAFRVAASTSTFDSSTVASSVHATLLGGITQGVSKPKTAPKISKGPSQQTSTKQSTLFNAIASATIGTSTVPLWQTTVSRDVPFVEIKERTSAVMNQIFGVQKLRYLQPKAVRDVLKRRSQIVVMATGGGKSLCYQLPAVVLGGTTIVVSPLIALMQDQAQALNQKGVAAAVISSLNGASANRDIMERLLGRSLSTSKSVPNKAREFITVLYVTPELVQTTAFRDALHELFKKNQLSLFAIDEAHCLSSWGHDFRKSYMRLDYLRDKFPEVPLIACTATATTKVLEDIKKTLRLEHSPCHIGSFDRPNIFYKVKYKDSLDALGGEGASSKDLAKFIKKQHASSAKRNIPCSGIVYCHTRADTTGLARAIEKETGISTVSYHGGMKPDERTQVQQLWTSGQAQVAVATVAFGMGIDLAHVRYVVHWNLAKTPEAFYQESGRGGRDGKPCISLLYYSKDDASKFQYLLSQRKSDDGNARELAALTEMVNYCTVPGCRRYRLLKHFGEKIDNPSTICENSCDYCVDPTRVQQAIEAAGAVGDFVCYKRQLNPPVARTPMDDEGDDMDTENFGAAIKVGGLHVKGRGAPTDTLDGDADISSGKPTANFVRASSILSKYEAIECKSSSSGFVNFKEKSDSNTEKSNDRIRIPQHLIPLKSAKAGALFINSIKEKSSSDYEADVEKLRDAIERTKAEHETRMLEVANRSKPRRPLPPPPPNDFLFKTKRKR